MTKTNQQKNTLGAELLSMRNLLFFPVCEQLKGGKALANSDKGRKRSLANADIPWQRAEAEFGKC